MKKEKSKINNQARALLALVLFWEVLVIVYVLIKQNFVESKLSVEHTLMIVFIIVVPPILVLLVKFMMPSSAWLNKATADTRNKMLLTEITRSFPLMLQLFSVLFVTFTLLEPNVSLQKFTQLFLFITLCVSVADSYYRQSYVYTCFFVVFACLYNPFYGIVLPDLAFALALMSIFLLFIFYVMFSIRSNYLAFSESRDAAQAIEAELQWMVKEVPRYHIDSFRRIISQKYSGQYLQKADSIEWRVTKTPHLVFCAMTIFNEEMVICIKGIKALKGFRAYYIFYNQGFKKMVCLEHQSSHGAQLLQEKLAEHHGFYILKIDYSKTEHIAS